MTGGRVARRLSAVAVALGCTAAGVLAPPDAVARQIPRGPGVFSISPGDHLVVGRPGMALTPTLVRNTTSQRLSVTLVPVTVTQNRDGSFTDGDGAADRRAAARALAVSERRFTMPAHSEHSVLERWRPGAGRRAVHAAVVFTATPVRALHGVHIVDRLLGLVLLAHRGAAPARGRVVGLAVSDFDRHRLQVVASLRNVGATFGTPERVGVTVRAAGGRVVSRATATPGVILPGVTREFPVMLPRRLAPGRYTATTDVRLDGRVASRARRFEVVAGGLLPAPSLIAEAVSVAGTVGGPAHVAVTVHNAGTRRGAPHATASLYPVRDGVASRSAVAVAHLGGAPLDPGGTRSVAIELGTLRGSHYEMVVRYASPFVAVAPRLVDFSPRRAPSQSSLAGLLTSDGVLAALGALVVGSLVLVARQRRATPRRSGPGVRLSPPS